MTYTEDVVLCLEIHNFTSKFSVCFVQFGDFRGELETLKRLYKSVQSEKEELEQKFSQLQDNYSLLSSQSKTVKNNTREFVLIITFLSVVSYLSFMSFRFPFCFYFLF